MKRSKFSLTHYKLLTCKMGSLIPVSWFEALPGDTIQQSTSALIRCAPLNTPVMHPVHVRFHHFFVPNRIIWSNWENFITGGPDGFDTTSHPFIDYGGNTHGTVSALDDYLGIPTQAAGTVSRVSALPFRAYSLIWNEFYRDQDLQTLLTVSTGDGHDTTTNTTLQNCDWEKDYLTSARPWEVKGPGVTLPLGTTAPVRGIGLSGSSFTDHAGVSVREADGATPTYAHSAQWGQLTSNASVKISDSGSASTLPLIFADLSTASAVDVNTVRHAFALQRFEEARARYGSRYTEYLRYLGVRSSDARLQRPEYLGGGRNTIQFSEVLQTAPTSSGTGGGTGGVGQYGGHGITAMRSNRYRRFFEEHGIVMTLMSVRPRTMYSNALNRAWARGQAGYSGTLGSKEDYWQRELQHIGQQIVDGSEVDSRINQTQFGFQDRYDEYRRMESSVAGQFRSTLDTWHLSREFGSSPALNASFVSCVPSTRVFADTSDDNLYVMAHQSIQARRLVAREGTSMTF